MQTGMRVFSIALVAVLALSASATTGCFVFDELDKGEKLMDGHSPTRNARARERRDRYAPRAPLHGDKKSEGVLARLLDVARSLPSRVAGLKFWGDGEAGRSGPSEPMVRCLKGGGVLFTTRLDCEAGGGQVLGTAGGA